MSKKTLQNSGLVLVPAYTRGSLYNDYGHSFFTIEKDSFYLEVDSSYSSEVGLLVESGEIIYFCKEKILSV